MSTQTAEPAVNQVPHLTLREKQLASDPIRKLIIRYSVPAIIGMLVNALYNVVDRFWIGQLHNTAALSGIGLTAPMSNILLGFMLMIGVGGAASISIKLGERKHTEAENVLANALTLCIFFGVVSTVAGLVWLRPLLLAFGASASTLPYAQDYLSIILLGNVFNTIGFSLNHTIRGAGNPRRSASTQLLGASINMVLDPLFILGFGWGVKGAAWATIISQIISMAWVVSYFLGQGSHLRLHLSRMKLQSKAVLQILSIGVAPFMMQVATSMVAVLANRTLRTYGGDVAIGVMTIITSMVILSTMPIFGLNQGMQPILGYNYGAKNYARVRETWSTGVISATLIVLAATILVQVFPEAIIRVFSSDPEILAIGPNALRVYLLFLPLIGFQIVSTVYFQNIGLAKISMFANLMRQVIFLIPLYLILPHFLGLKGIWMASPAADLLAVIVTAVLIVFEMRRLRQLELAQAQDQGKVQANAQAQTK